MMDRVAVALLSGGLDSTTITQGNAESECLTTDG